MFMKALGIITFILNAAYFMIYHDMTNLTFCALIAMALMEKK